MSPPAIRFFKLTPCVSPATWLIEWLTNTAATNLSGFPQLYMRKELMNSRKFYCSWKSCTESRSLQRMYCVQHWRRCLLHQYRTDKRSLATNCQLGCDNYLTTAIAGTALRNRTMLLLQFSCFTTRPLRRTVYFESEECVHAYSVICAVFTLGLLCIAHCTYCMQISCKCLSRRLRLNALSYRTRYPTVL